MDTFSDSLDIMNRACQHLGSPRISSLTEDSVQANELIFSYDKLRQAELRRNVWRFATRRAILRPIGVDTMLLDPNLWDSGTVYLPGSVVKDSVGILWVSTLPDNLNNSPGDTTAWDQYFGPMTVEPWDTSSSTAYSGGELVYVASTSPQGAFVIYCSLVGANGDTPGTPTAWDTTVTYHSDDVVTSSGSQWRSLIEVNQGNTPAVGPANWDPAAAYTVGNTVTGSDQFIYTSLGSNTGIDPTTNGGVNWTRGVVNGWSKSPTIFPSSIKWLPLFSNMHRISLIYPIGAGPMQDNTTRNIFRLPGNYLREASQAPKQGSTSLWGAPSGLMYNDWEFESDYIVSRTFTSITYRFVADMVTVTKMDPMFCEGLAARLAVETCERITQSTAKIQTIASAYSKFMGEARLVNGIETGSEEPPVDDFLACRL